MSGTELVYTVIGLSGRPLAWSRHELECRRYNEDYCRGEGIVSGGFVHDPENAYRGWRIAELGREHDVCDICDNVIRGTESSTDRDGEITHTACVNDWFRRSFGAEDLS